MARLTPGGLSAVVAGALALAWAATAFVVIQGGGDFTRVILFDLVVQLSIISAAALLAWVPVWARVLGVAGGAMGLLGAALQFLFAGHGWLQLFFWTSNVLLAAWVIGAATRQAGPLRILGFVAGALRASIAFVNMALGGIDHLWMLAEVPLALWLLLTGVADLRRPSPQPL